MAGKKLTANVLVLDDDGNAVVLEKDSEVPAKFAGQVGDHCFAADAAKRENK